MKLPSWQIPPGVSREAWDYIQSEKIAEEYEQFLDDHALFQLDLKLVQQQLRELESLFPALPLLVADLGCGTGRVANSMNTEFHRVLNIDLSVAMLGQCRAQRSRPSANVVELCGNLAELQFLKPDCVHLATCLFSSLGMIRPRENRIQLLRKVFESLRTHGRLLLHVHNRYRSLLDPGGLAWLAKGALGQILGRSEFGDRIYPYRGLPRMHLHIYSLNEIRSDLKQAGFQSLQALPIQVSGADLLDSNTMLPGIRAGGYFLIAKKD